MKLIIEKDYESLSDRAVFIIKNLIENKEVKTIAFPTGKTPMLLYNKIADHYRNNEIDLSKITGFMVDEYYPISQKSKINFRNVIDKYLCDHVKMKKMYYFDSENKDFLQECNNYETKIKEEGGIDLAILGIGDNGHIGFNEPGSDFLSKVRLVELKSTTIMKNKIKYSTGELNQKYALTIGILNIFKSKKILIMASGREKSETVKKIIEGPINNELPASILKIHQDITMLVDIDAAVLVNEEILSLIKSN